MRIKKKKKEVWLFSHYLISHYLKSYQTSQSSPANFQNKVCTRSTPSSASEELVLLTTLYTHYIRHSATRHINFCSLVLACRSLLYVVCWSAEMLDSSIILWQCFIAKYHRDALDWSWQQKKTEVLTAITTWLRWAILYFIYAPVKM